MFTQDEFWIETSGAPGGKCAAHVFGRTGVYIAVFLGLQTLSHIERYAQTLAEGYRIGTSAAGSTTDQLGRTITASTGFSAFALLSSAACGCAGPMTPSQRTCNGALTNNSTRRERAAFP